MHTYTYGTQDYYNKRLLLDRNHLWINAAFHEMQVWKWKYFDLIKAPYATALIYNMLIFSWKYKLIQNKLT